MRAFEPAARWPVAPVLAALVAGWVAMTWPWLSGKVTIPWDAKAHFQPQIQFLAQSLARGESPFWNPFVFAGHPQIADPQSMIFSLPFVLQALVNGSPSLWAVDVTVLLAELAGAAALMLWMRDLRWHWAGALIGGLVFAFGGAMAWRVQHTGQVLSLVYLPFVLLFLDRALARGSIWYGLAAGVMAAFIVLGRDQVGLLVVYLLIGYVLWQWFAAEQRGAFVQRAWKPIVVAGIAGAALIAIPVTLTALLAAESNRPAIDYIGAGRGSLHPALLLTLLFPQLFGAAGRMEDYWGPPSFAWNDTGIYIAQNMGQIYIGIIPLALIGIAALRGSMWDRQIRFWVLALTLMLLYALGWYTPVFRVMFELLPGVNFYRRPADAAFLINMCLAVLAGYAVHRLFAEPWRGIARAHGVLLAGVAIAALLIAIGLGFRIDRVPLLPSPLVTALIAIGAGAMAIYMARDRIALEPWVAGLMLAGVTAVDLGTNNGPTTSSALPPKVYDALQPATQDPTITMLKKKVAEGRSETRRDRIELLGLGFHWPNVSMAHGLENTLGYNPVRLRLYSEATGAEDTVGLPDQRKIAPLFGSYSGTLANLLGLRYVASGAPLEQVDKKLPPGDLKPIAGNADALIYENANALPRVLFVTMTQGADFAAMLKTGQWPEGFDPRRTVLLDGVARGTAYLSGMGAIPKEPDRVRIVSYRNTEVVVEATSTRGGWVVLNDLWHPWWFAEVDGQPAPVLKANVMFRAVEVPSGKHTVRFVFRPLMGAWGQIAAGRG
jgi:hypothetical protein